MKLKNKKGSALLIVLVLIFTVSVFALSFIEQSSMELACGDNMITRGALDYLAESGLEHAKGLLLNPQDVAGTYWTGATSQKLDSGSNDFYNVSVSFLSDLNYQITSTAYRQQGYTQVAESKLVAEFRFDPFIAYWQGNNLAVPIGMDIYGDAYFDDDVQIFGSIYGDAYGEDDIVRSYQCKLTGTHYEDVAEPPVSPPGIEYKDFEDGVYYIGETQYTIGQLYDKQYTGLTLGPTANNPKGIYYRNGDLELKGNCQIDGTLIVKDKLKMLDNAYVVIESKEDFPALITGDQVEFEKYYTYLETRGYTQIEKEVDMKNTFSTFKVYGALYVLTEGIKNSYGCHVYVYGSQQWAALEVWPEEEGDHEEFGEVLRWSPAADGFFKYIKRQ